MTRYIPALAFAAALAATPAAADCTLQSLGTLDMTINTDGTILVPVSVSGTSYPFVIDLGSTQSAVTSAIAAKARLDIRALPGHITWHGVTVDRQADIPRLKLAGLAGPAHVLVLPANAPLPTGVEGVVGTGTLRAADIEFDFRAARLTLFAPEHCPGQAVHWADSAAIIPIAVNDSGRVMFDATLDDKPVKVSFGSGNTGAMPFSIAQRIFAVHYMTDAADFRTLSIEGIQISHPAIRVFDDYAMGCQNAAAPAACFGRPDLELGLSQVKNLHLLFAFSEGKLYATAADAHK